MFELTKEHEMFRATVREFAEAEIAPFTAQWDREHHFPVDLIPKMGELGLFGLTAPEEFGGAEGTSPHCAWPLRSWAEWTRPWASPCPRGSAWGSTRSCRSAPRSRRNGGCRI